MTYFMGYRRGGITACMIVFFLRSTLVCLAAASNNLTFAFVQSPSQTLLMLFER
jgi:hypothetical protein